MTLVLSPFANRKSLAYRIKSKGGTCERGQRADLTGCTPASGESPVSDLESRIEKTYQAEERTQESVRQINDAVDNVHEVSESLLSVVEDGEYRDDDMESVVAQHDSLRESLGDFDATLESLNTAIEQASQFDQATGKRSGKELERVKSHVDRAKSRAEKYLDRADKLKS